MFNLERDILRIYKENIKMVGGRGPKNVYVKIQGAQIDIYFTMDKSPFEKFVFSELTDGPRILENIYQQIEQKVRSGFIAHIHSELNVALEFESFEMDENLNNFRLTFKRL